MKQLLSHDGGRTIDVILSSLRALGYTVEHRVLNTLNFGLPQKRERVVIVGNQMGLAYEWPDQELPMKSLVEILDSDVDSKYFASSHIREKRLASHTPASSSLIWHENKSGHISSYPYSCALRAGASYNYLLVDGIRRLTEREMLRLQGFPESFRPAESYAQARKQAGNAISVPVMRAVMQQINQAEENLANDPTSLADHRTAPAPVPA